MGGFNLGWLGFAPKKWNKKASEFFTGTKEKHKRVSTLLPEQIPLSEQLYAAGMGPGAGGAFGTAADYYRDLMSDDSQTAQAMFAPEQRRFQEDIIPGLSEQFAGMGAGNLSSSGFRNAAVGAGTDLSERLGAIRANLRAQGAAGLTNIGQLGLGNYSQDVMTQPASQGFLEKIAPAAVSAATTFFTGSPMAGAAAYQSTNSLFGSQNAYGSPNVGRSTSPYGNMQAPQQNFQLPNRSF